MLFFSELWQQDMDLAIAAIPGFPEDTDFSVMVTGSTGLIGKAIVHMLLRYNDTHNGKIRVIATGRSLDRLQAGFSELSDRADLSFCEFDAASPVLSVKEKVDYIIHAASPASPDAIMRQPVETMLSNLLGLDHLLNYSKNSGVKRLLFISSSEVYGRKDPDTPAEEGNYGSIDPLNPRNSYSVSKLAGETLCVSYREEKGVDSVIVRPGHIYGPTASRSDIRVSSSWVYDAVAGKDIVMKSKGEQIRSYCHCLDCASAVLTVLFHGKSGEAYNISNRSSIFSIADLAKKISSDSGVSLIMEIPTEQEKKAFNPMKNSSLCSDKLESLGWKGVISGEQGISHTISILREVKDLG